MMNFFKYYYKKGLSTADIARYINAVYGTDLVHREITECINNYEKAIEKKHAKKKEQSKKKEHANENNNGKSKKRQAKHTKK